MSLPLGELRHPTTPDEAALILQSGTRIVLEPVDRDKEFAGQLFLFGWDISRASDTQEALYGGSSKGTFDFVCATTVDEQFGALDLKELEKAHELLVKCDPDYKQDFSSYILWSEEYERNKAYTGKPTTPLAKLLCGWGEAWT